MMCVQSHYMLPPLRGSAGLDGVGEMGPWLALADAEPSRVAVPALAQREWPSPRPPDKGPPGFLKTIILIV